MGTLHAAIDKNHRDIGAVLKRPGEFGAHRADADYGDTCRGALRDMVIDHALHERQHRDGFFTERSLPSNLARDAESVIEEVRQPRAGEFRIAGIAERLLHLAEDLGFADHHRIEGGGDTVEMAQGAEGGMVVDVRRFEGDSPLTTEEEVQNPVSIDCADRRRR